MNVRKKPSAPLDGGGAKFVGPANLTAADADALDCGVCFLPLKPPIFQCDVGHMLCLPCHDKLKGIGKCDVCGVAVAGGYRRCHGMERLVDSLRAACPNAPYGCAATPPYHSREEHLLACPHAPRHCPVAACGFAGSTAALGDHIASAHRHSSPCEGGSTSWPARMLRATALVRATAIMDHLAATHKWASGRPCTTNNIGPTPWAWGIGALVVPTAMATAELPLIGATAVDSPSSRLDLDASLIPTWENQTWENHAREKLARERRPQRIEECEGKKRCGQPNAETTGFLRLGDAAETGQREVEAPPAQLLQSCSASTPHAAAPNVIPMWALVFLR
ncbi:hypothetical protein HU200_020479 [Digitaria exilis]|uniref:RING-type E3 ubiquitin transferase n=1 Tax=Digitaria exilis TaxID=1010633 RepID=A0A835F1Z8_9POAL|nr:hypothetical protein HU200_020479 [Digitaria exilis]